MAIANLYAKKRKFREALPYINKAIEIDELNTVYWRKYAEINLNLDAFEEAVNAFQQCILLQDYDLVIWLGLVDTLCFLGEYEDALKNLLKAKTYFKDFAEIEYRLSGLYFKFKSIKKGVVHLKAGLAIDFEYQFILKELFPEVFKMQDVQDIVTSFKKTS